MTLKEILRAIDEATDPSAMSAEAALTFMEDIADDLGMKIEALREELNK